MGLNQTSFKTGVANAARSAGGKVGGGRVGWRLHGFSELQTALLTLPRKVQRKVVKPALKKMEKKIHLRVIQAFSGMPVGVVTASILTAIASARVRLARDGARKKNKAIRFVFDLPANRADAIAVNALEYGWTDRFGHRHRSRAPMRNAVDLNRTQDLDQVLKEIRNGIVKLAQREFKKAAKAVGVAPRRPKAFKLPKNPKAVA